MTTVTPVLTLPDYRNLRSIKQIAESCPAVTEGQLRWWIFNAETSGIGVALVRVGGRVYVDVEAFNTWLARGRQAAMDAPR